MYQEQVVHTVLRYSYLLPGNLLPILSCFVAYFVVKTVVYSYLCPEKGGPYCPVYSYLRLGTVVSTVQYISTSWERWSILSCVYLDCGNGGPYCPVLTIVCRGNRWSILSCL